MRLWLSSGFLSSPSLRNKRPEMNDLLRRTHPSSSASPAGCHGNPYVVQERRAAQLKLQLEGHLKKTVPTSAESKTGNDITP